MTEGTIVKWNKKVGEAVAAGDVICEIQVKKTVSWITIIFFAARNDLAFIVSDVQFGTPLLKNRPLSPVLKTELCFGTGKARPEVVGLK
jgi:hypothetical protein